MSKALIEDALACNSLDSDCWPIMHPQVGRSKLAACGAKDGVFRFGHCPWRLIMMLTVSATILLMS